jgi:hypothetical protein
MPRSRISGELPENYAKIREVLDQNFTRPPETLGDVAQVRFTVENDMGRVVLRDVRAEHS